MPDETGVADDGVEGLEKLLAMPSIARLAQWLRKALRESRALRTFGFMCDALPYICNIHP
jgi:hypothetical protein